MAAIEDPEKSRVVVWLRHGFRLQHSRHFSHRLDGGGYQKQVDVLLPKERREQANTSNTIRGVGRQSGARRGKEHPISIAIKQRNTSSVTYNFSAGLQHPSHAEW